MSLSEYIVVKAREVKFIEDGVNKKILEGYRPIGGLAIHDYDGHLFFFRR